ncbi:hypothetical protein QBC47DRAFT_390363 [Echria macrotheca]|uniref:Uncharacterized protein n=1 Tax=Echria macrotheca TaxID=438768 RepID=A0AAJ0B4I8_9PEZI|nr:hypothetical protein QBC47DRAFT_390363 [Echria macrotheca]
MDRRRSARQAAKQQKAVEVVEISSDSEPEVVPMKMKSQSPPKKARISDVTQLTEEDYASQPLLRAASIQYDSPQTKTPARPVASPPQTKPESAASSKLPVRVKEAGSSEQERHISIEIEVPTSVLGKRKATRETVDGGAGSDGEREVFKTPSERKHITFNDSDHEEFVTPLEAPPKNVLEAALSPSAAAAAEVEKEEDSDDEAPEAVSSHAAGAQLAQASKAAAKAAERQATEQKLKRQARDLFFKQQAQKKISSKPIDITITNDSGGNGDVRVTKSASLFPEKKKAEIPAILPIDILESDSEDDRQQKGSANATKRRRVDLAGSTWIPETRAPRDRRVASTVYRLVSTGKEVEMAPKAHKQSRNLKELLMRRTRTPQVKRHGFLVKNH